MTISLGTNVPSYTSRVQLDKVTKGLTTTMQRLTTGLKINNAKDDAAGLVISENMEAVIRASEQAMKNIQTASSFLTVAEDGMVSIGDHYQRINDLLENMANDTNDLQSRTAAVEEIIERLDEINRLADSTDFSGRKMLNADPDEIIVQMGSDSTELSTLDISPALRNCHTSVGAMKTFLPPNLSLNSVKFKTKVGTETVDVTIAKNKNGDYYDAEGNIIKEEGGKWYYFDPVTGAKGDELVDENGDSVDVSALTESGFDPTNANCRAYMKTIQDAISDIAERRGLLGAYENRMESSYDSLAARITSLKSARMVYTDADIAEEATQLTTDQILEQINISILGTANALQQNALALLS